MWNTINRILTLGLVGMASLSVAWPECLAYHAFFVFEGLLLGAWIMSFVIWILEE